MCIYIYMVTHSVDAAPPSDRFDSKKKTCTMIR